MEKITNFIDEHKKGIVFVGACILAYSIGYRRGYKIYEKVLVDAAKAINETVTNF